MLSNFFACATVRVTMSAAFGRSWIRPSDFARDHARGVEVTGGARLRVTRRLVLYVLHQLALAAKPFRRVRIAHDTAVERRGPNILPRDIEHDAAQRVVAGPVDDTTLRLGVARRLARRIEARAHQHAVGTEHQRRCEPASVRDAARRDDGHIWQRVGDLGHQRHGAARGAVAAGLGALRHDDVGTGGGRLLRLPESLHLADELRARRADFRRERADVTER